MADQVEICNNALIKAGGAIINSIDDETKEARLCKASFNTSMRYVLRMHSWNCVTARATLSPLATTPDHEWSYAFAFPSDLLRFLKIYQNDEYRIERKKILANSDTLEIKYVFDPGEELSLLDVGCAEAVASYLAFNISYALTQDRILKERLFSEYVEILRQTKSVDAKEDPALRLDASEWEDSRYDGASRTLRDV